MLNFDKYPDNFDDCPKGTTLQEWERDKKGMCISVKYFPDGNGGLKKVWSAKTFGSRRRGTRIQRQFGSEAPSQLIQSKVPGGLPSYVISEGALEQEEIDHIGLVEDEREVTRQKKEKSDSVKAIGNLASIAKKEKRGNRFSTMKKIQAEGLA